MLTVVVFDKCTMSLVILFDPKFDILWFFPILMHLCQLLLIFYFPKNVIVLDRGIKQIQHHVMTDNSGHVPLHPLFYLLCPNGLPNMRQE